MNSFLLVCIGGMIGTGARYLLSGGIHRLFETPFPIGTFFINILGSFLIGLFMEYALGRSYLSDSVRLMVAIGILGGFTTFSSFSYETIALVRAGNLPWAAFNLILTNFLCLVSTLGGMKLISFLK
ncbi:MAG: fluoride efflux transporter CrcB [Deltaproteobacteria bacterium]|nr:fluoride efflux transporter CrcB [Deltaproteobacteria bacterium]